MSFVHRETVRFRDLDCPVILHLTGGNDTQAVDIDQDRVATTNAVEPLSVVWLTAGHRNAP